MYCIIFSLILFLLIINYLLFYKINQEGGDHVDTKISNTTILPVFNSTLNTVHNFIHKIYNFGELKRKFGPVKLNKIKYNQERIKELMNVLNKTKIRNDIILSTSLKTELNKMKKSLNNDINKFKIKR